MKRFASALVALVLFVLSGACGNGATPRHAERDRARPVDASGAIDASAEVEAGPNKLELLAARHDRVAPGTREIARQEIDLAVKGAETLALPPFESDTCVRALFDAEAPTAVMLENARAMTLANADGAQGAIGAAGPVCFRKGDAATFRFNGQSRLRIVVWASP